MSCPLCKKGKCVQRCKGPEGKKKDKKRKEKKKGKKDKKKDRKRDKDHK